MQTEMKDGAVNPKQPSYWAWDQIQDIAVLFPSTRVYIPAWYVTCSPLRGTRLLPAALCDAVVWESAALSEFVKSTERLNHSRHGRMAGLSQADSCKAPCHRGSSTLSMTETVHSHRDHTSTMVDRRSWKGCSMMPYQAAIPVAGDGGTC